MNFIFYIPFYLILFSQCDNHLFKLCNWRFDDNGKQTGLGKHYFTTEIESKINKGESFKV